MGYGSFNGTILTKLANIKEQLTTAFIFAFSLLFLSVNEFTVIYCNLYRTGIVAQ